MLNASLGPGIAASAWRICPSSVSNGAFQGAGRPMTTSAARAGATSRAARYASRNRRRRAVALHGEPQLAAHPQSRHAWIRSILARAR